MQQFTLQTIQNFEKAIKDALRVCLAWAYKHSFLLLVFFLAFIKMLFECVWYEFISSAFSL